MKNFTPPTKHGQCDEKFDNFKVTKHSLGADAAISRGMASGSSVAKPAAALTMRTAAWEATSSFVRL